MTNIEDLEYNCYYKVVIDFYSSIHIHYIKIKNIIGNKIYYQYVLNETYFKDSTDAYWYKIFDKNDTYTKIKLKDIVHLFPENHVEKLHYFRNIKINNLLNGTNNK